MLPGAPMASWPGCFTGLAQDAGRMTRKAHVALHEAAELRLVYAGWGLGGPNGPIRVKASLEYPAGRYLPARFPGMDSSGYVTILPGLTAVSQACGVAVPRGARFFSNTSVVPLAGGYPVGRDHGAVAFHPPDACTPDCAADHTMAPQPNPSVSPQYCYIPLAICGAAGPVVAIIGDSIAQGVGSNVIPARAEETGIVQQACQRAGIGYLNFGINNSNAAHWAGFLRGSPLLDGLSGDAVVILGSNDLAGFRLGRSAAPALMAHLRQIWAILAARGRVWQATIPPKTHSSDGYRTLANQWPWNPNFGPEPGAGSPWSIVNAFIRTVPSPLAGIIDLAARAAVLHNGAYLWRPGCTTDGTHPIPEAGDPDFISSVPVGVFT